MIEEARTLGLPVTPSSNGTFVRPRVARRLAALGVRYVGVSFDGLGAGHDAFRGRRGAFDRSLAGIRALRSAGVRAGVRVTLSEAAIAALTGLFALVEREGVTGSASTTWSRRAGGAGRRQRARARCGRPSRRSSNGPSDGWTRIVTSRC